MAPAGSAKPAGNAAWPGNECIREPGVVGGRERNVSSAAWRSRLTSGRAVQFEQTWRTLNGWTSESQTADAIAVSYGQIVHRSARRRIGVVLTRARQRHLTHALMLLMAMGVVVGSTVSAPLPGGSPELATGEGASLRPEGAIVSSVLPRTLPSVTDQQKQVSLQLAVAAPEPQPAKPAPELKQYVVDDGDNPFDIANKFRISDETLLAANGLGADSVLQIGQRLLIPPVSGVVVSTQPGDTPKAIADQWKIDLTRLVSINHLAVGLNALLPGEPLVIPDALPPVSIYPVSTDDETDPKAALKTDAPAVSTARSTSQSRQTAPILPPVATRSAVRRSGPNNFPWGQCTYWAAQERPDIGSNVIGNASSWLYSARASGLPTGTMPRVGAIVVYQPGADGAAWTGHVAYVTSVAGDGAHFTVSEMNFPYWGRVTYRSSRTGWGVGFIY